MTGPTCRRCSECTGQKHHWMTATPDADGDGDIVVQCKHCDAETYGAMCDICGAVFPLPIGEKPERGEWYCPECASS